MGAATVRTSSNPRKSSPMLQRRFDPVGHERERGPAVEPQRIPGVMGEHEDRMMKWRIGAPPPAPRLLGIPRPRMTAKHVAAHDGRADIQQLFFHHPRAVVDLTSVLAVRRAPHPERSYPLVETLAANAKRVAHALVGAGHEAVE